MVLGAIAALAPSTRAQEGRPPTTPVRETRFTLSVRDMEGDPRFVTTVRRRDEGEPTGEDASPFTLPPAIVAAHRRRIDAAIAQIDALCTLTDDQQSKLRLAARGELTQWEREARKCQQLLEPLETGRLEHGLLAMESVRKLNAHLTAGHRDRDSLFQKVLRGALTGPQGDALARGALRDWLRGRRVTLSSERLADLADMFIAADQAAPSRAPLPWNEADCRAIQRTIDRDALGPILDAEQRAALLIE